MACEDCDKPASLDRLEERVKHLETKTHIGDTFAIIVLALLGALAFLKYADKIGISLDG